MTYIEARRASRRHFPNWSRRARARWVIARMRCGAQIAPMSTLVGLQAETKRVMK